MKLSMGTRLLIIFGIGGMILNIGIFAAIAQMVPKIFIPQDIPSAYGAPAKFTSGGQMPYSLIVRVQKAQEVMNELSHTSDVEVFEKSARESGLGLYRKKDGVVVKAGDQNFEEHYAKSSPFILYPDYQTGSDSVARDEAGVRWIVTFPPKWRHSPWGDPRYHIVVVIYFLTSLLMIFIFTRWQLAPLKALKRGAEAISRSDFKFRIDNIQRSELGDLARAFNTMSERVHSLIQSKERLLMNVSHDLRTPLTRIKLAIANGGGDALPRVQKNIVRMESLVLQLLEMGRTEQENLNVGFKPVSISSLLSAIRADFQSELLKIELPQEVEVLGNEELLRRVFENLIDNGLKYSQGAVTVKVKKSAEAAQIEVIDQGPGVPAEYLEKIFDHFFRLEDARTDGSFGLGLSFCRQVVRQHGGEIVAAANVPRGLIIRITLPTYTRNIP